MARAWWEEAACKGMDTNLFFGHDITSRRLRDTLTAVCNSCPVLTECLDDALKEEDQVGWRANTTARQRIRLLKSVEVSPL
jgi:hypothetical protein